MCVCVCFFWCFFGANWAYVRCKSLINILLHYITMHTIGVENGGRGDGELLVFRKLAHTVILIVHIFMNVNKLCLNQISRDRLYE